MVPDRLAAAWVGLAAEAGLPDRHAAAVLAALAERYGQAHRAYHTLTHVAAVLDALGWLHARGSPAEDLTALRLAAWFHDAVYDPYAADNEERSARLAATLLAPEVPAARRGRVAALVRATAAHLPVGDPALRGDAALLCDADLSVLAADRATYRAYAAAVRREYAGVCERRFRRGRARLLRRLLARPWLYQTAWMRRHAELAARRNLTAELYRLWA